ncbi:MAG: energy transducer TonB [Bdellovibrio sp.]|nr:energy transducer TonB [Bdellovibrio sp.]
MHQHAKLKWLLYCISLVLHLCVLFFIKQDYNQRLSNRETSKSLRVVLKPREIPAKIIEKLKHQQVVNNELNGEETADELHKYYGKKNQTYKHETIPRNVGRFKPSNHPEEETANGMTNKKKKITMADLLVKKPGNIEDFAVKSPLQHKTFYIGIEENMQASNNDYLEGVDVGDATNLNTKEYKFWGFYNRMRLRLEPIWEKLLDERIRRNYVHGKKIMIGSQTMTLIKITLDEEGNVFRLKVLHSSGIAEIDDIAIDAITLSGPFASVPRQMLVDKIVEIEWGFVVTP